MEGTPQSALLVGFMLKFCLFDGGEVFPYICCRIGLLAADGDIQASII